MKAFLLALFISAPAAFAGTGLAAPAAGTYAFQGEFSVAIKVRFKLVYSFTEAGAKELAEREAAGEECWHKGNAIYQCKSLASIEGAAEEVRSRVNAQIGGQTLVLGEAKGEPSEISKGDDVAFFWANQPATFRGKTYENYRLVSTSAGWSMRLGEETEAQFNIDANGELALSSVMAVTKSREEFSDYLVFARFRRM